MACLVYFVLLALPLAVASDECSQGGLVQPLKWPSGAWVNVFADLTFDCAGEVSRWEYYAKAAGTFFAGIWRPEGKKKFRYIGSNIITADSVGVHTANIPAGSRIAVEVGDVIGIHYSQSANENRGGVVPYDDSDHGLTAGVTKAMLSRFYASNKRDNTMVAGKTVVSGLIGRKRLPAIKAFVGQASGGASELEALLGQCQADLAASQVKVADLQREIDLLTIEPIIPTAAPTAVLSETGYRFTLDLNGIDYILQTAPIHVALESDDYCEQFGMKLAQIENDETLAALSRQLLSIQDNSGVTLTEVATGERSSVNLDRDIAMVDLNAAGWNCATLVPDGDAFKLVGKKCQGERAVLCAAVPLYC